MRLVYFRPRRTGPEREIEEAVANNVTYLFPARDHVMWVAGSVPLGAGMPDLVVVACKPEVRSLARADVTSAEILAYLRVVRGAKFDTICERIERPRRVIARSLDDLMEAQAVSEAEGILVLSSPWRDILADIVTIEAKVSKWQSAVSQAARNTLFAHRSYVALPS